MALSSTSFAASLRATDLPFPADQLPDPGRNASDGLNPANQMAMETAFPPTSPPIKCRLPPHDDFENVIVPSLYIVICAVGLLGNGVVLVLLIRQDQSHVHGNKPSVTNILVINLAVADFIFVGALPLWATETFLRGRWLFGNFGCKILSFISLLNLYGSVFFLVAMGIDRYLAVVFAVRARNYRTPRNALRVCFGIWLFASIIASQALAFREICVDGHVAQCRWKLPPGVAYLNAYYVARTTLGFFLPFFVIMYCYIFIIVSLRRRSRNMSASGARITNQQQKVTRVILAVISLFVVCWLPNHIVTVIDALTMDDPLLQQQLHLRTASLISTCLAYANSSINPLLYAFMKEDVRLQLIALITKTCGLEKKDNSARVTSQAPPPAVENQQRRQATLSALGRHRDEKFDEGAHPSDDANETLFESMESPPKQHDREIPWKDDTQRPLETVVISQAPNGKEAATNV